ncbi:hypothetical protein [Streptomyces radicis]|uniref:Uncharacterized protein n=1 Tax=Streptomyces radicis TaxID=1750517 RepID=A0A3A9VRA6_9ACTN|nr:hypothetical protein [Streptomyces radicis]RKN03565.1 hypothetical protein D7319_31170 [Streptomyces radicis]RKN13426.1 hypothetical protein D7318_31165 [Streptomyces radicis]
MRGDRVRGAAGAFAIGALAAHLVATVLQNTPDSYNQDLRKFTGGWPLPGWRFFAPNPGVQNVHLLVREAMAGSAEPTPWRDVTPEVEHGWRQVLWNPGSRGPKALFDAMQQLSVMSANQADFAWVTQSSPYQLVFAASRAAAADDSEALQFLLMNVFPSAPPEQRMKPILTSEWIALGSPADAEEAAR